MNILQFFILFFPAAVIVKCKLSKIQPFGNVINLAQQNIVDIKVENSVIKLMSTTVVDYALHCGECCNEHGSSQRSSLCALHLKSIIIPPRSKVKLVGNPTKVITVNTSHLEELDARHCDVKEIHIKSDNIKKLQLDHNFLEVLSGDMITSSHLEILSLSNNLIFAIRSETFKGLVAVKSIDLSTNKIVSLDEDTFAGNLLLDHLDLRHNKIVSLHLTFNGLTLSLAYNKLTITDNFISKMPYLSFLDLSYNGMVEIPQLGSITLQHLDLHGNNISICRLTSFQQLPLLEYLDMRQNQFSVIFSPKAFMYNNLKQLLLDGNPWKCKCDRMSYKFFRFLHGPPAVIEDFELLKCEHNGQTWSRECNKKWMRFKQLTEPMQKFAFGCFAFITALILSALTMVAFAKCGCMERTRSRRSSVNSTRTHENPDLPPTYEDAVKFFATPTKEIDPPKYEDLELQRLNS